MLSLREATLPVIWLISGMKLINIRLICARRLSGQVSGPKILALKIQMFQQNIPHQQHSIAINSRVQVLDAGR